jgi:hypothetical protein
MNGTGVRSWIAGVGGPFRNYLGFGIIRLGLEA